MKKLLLSILVLIGITLILVYTFIPTNIRLSKSVFLKTKLPVASRLLMDGNNWMKWLPGDSNYAVHRKADSITFRFKNYYYTIGKAIMNTAQVSILNNQKPINSLISVLQIKEDSVAVEWKAEINAGMNPISRIQSFQEAKELESDMGNILENLQTYLSKKGNIYGLIINQQQVVDTILISKKYVSENFPSTAEIYSLINDLRKYISKEGGLETNPPMLNISNAGGSYRTMVAIPVNKQLPEKDNYVFKRMIPGKILVTQVKGGDYTARQALKQLELYINDNHLSSPAIPFESLITDRSQETDTTKWITKVYYPIY